MTDNHDFQSKTEVEAILQELRGEDPHAVKHVIRDVPSPETTIRVPDNPTDAQIQEIQKICKGPVQSDHMFDESDTSGQEVQDQ